MNLNKTTFFFVKIGKQYLKFLPTYNNLNVRVLLSIPRKCSTIFEHIFEVFNYYFTSLKTGESKY